MEPKFKKGELVTFIQSEENKYAQGDKGRIVSSRKEGGQLENYFYTVTVEGNEIENVPEDHLHPALDSTAKQVDDILREAEKNKAYKDSDIRVGGSRKEKQAYKDLITGKDLENIEKDSVLAKQLIKKDKVYPKLIIANEIDKGSSGGASFLKYKLREACGAIPPDNPKKRKFYVEFIAYIVETMNDVLSIKMFKDACSEIFNNTIKKAVVILSPELKQELDTQEQEMKVLAADYQNKKEKIDSIAEYFNKQYSTWSFESDNKILAQIAENEQDKKKLAEYVALKAINATAQKYIANKVIPIEVSFLEENGFRYPSRARFDILTEIFGKRFANFLSSGGYDYQDEALKYDGLTKEESEREIEKHTESAKKKIKQYDEAAELFSDKSKTYKEKVELADKLHKESSLLSWGIPKQKFNLYSPKHLFYNDVRNYPERLDIFIEEHIKQWDKEKIRYASQIKAVEEKYKVRENTYSFAEKEGKGKSAERTELVANSGVPLSYIKRDGGIKVMDIDLDTDEKIKSFYPNILGIKRFEYGNYLPDKERVQHARHFACAIIDMAEMLNWDVKSMIGLGDLGVKFASSGRGKAAAHYEPDRIAINLTRSAGDGTVSHEMAHYIDNILTRIFPSINKHTIKRHSTYASYTSAFSGGGANVDNKAIYEAMKDVTNFIKNGTLNIKGENVSKIDNLDELHWQYLKDKSVKIKVQRGKMVPRYRMSMPPTLDGWIEKERKRYLDFNQFRNNKAFLSAVLNHYKIDEYEFTFHLPKNTTALYAYSDSMSSEYWSFPWELFARSFEAYMFDKLAKLNRSNNYLVSGN